MDRTQSIQTILMTDVVGSTRMWAAHPLAMPAAIERLERLADAAVEAEGGRVVKRRGEGDSLFCLLPHPAAAARAAIVLLRALSTEPWPDGLSLAVRAAVHCGPAHVRGEDLFGPVPNRCARLREVAHGGQILLTGAARSQIGSAEGVAFRDLGRHRLRDLDEPESVAQIMVEGLPADFPPLRSLTALRNNLPLQTTSFVGREALRRDLMGRLETDRLTTLTGAGGCGKTRLSLQLGADTIDRFPEGAWFVELAELTEEPAIVQAIGEACGYRDLPDGDARTLADRLRGRALFLLDNAEHALGPIGRVIATLMAAAPELRFIVTSREPMHLRGERVHRVPPLDIPSAGCDDPFVVAESEAGGLFLDRARLHFPEFALLPSNARAVVEIVRRLDGIPLCLEMAASHVNYLSPEQIASRLHDRFALLEDEGADAPPRHRTMRETIAWQVETLDDEERLLFFRLAAFAGMFTLEAAEAVGGGPPLSPDTVIRRLRALVDKSLVVAVPGGTETCYRLLETIAQYAAEMGEAEIAAVLPSLFDWAHRLGGACYAGMNGLEQGKWVELFDTTDATLRRALEWAFAADESRAGSLVRDLTRYWHFRGRYGEGYAFLVRAARRCTDPTLRSELENATAVFASRLGDREAAERAYRDVLARDGVAPNIRARVALNLGILLNEGGDLDGAHMQYDAAMRLANEIGDEALQRLAGYNAALALADGGHLEEASARLEAVRDASERAGDPNRVALCLESLANVQVLRDDPRGAARYLRDAFRAIGSQSDAQFTADALLDAAWVAARSGLPEEAALLLAGHRAKQRATRAPTARRNLHKVDRIEAALTGQTLRGRHAMPGESVYEEPFLEIARQTALRVVEAVVDSETFVSSKKSLS